MNNVTTKSPGATARAATHGIVTTTSLNDRVLGAIGVKGAKLLGSVRLTMGSAR